LLLALTLYKSQRLKLKLPDIAISRLINQQIAKTNFQSAHNVVDWLGAVQAQDFAMAKLAVGLRFHNSTEVKVNTAFDKAEILRTHLLRPTWHLVSYKDIYWMLELSAPRLKSLLKTRLKELELTEKVLTKSFNVIESALADKKSIARNQLVLELKKSKIRVDENRASHIFMQAELDGLICSGINNNNDSTYALLEERIPDKNKLTKEEALAKLAIKYFQSHSPATISDFIWWSGLNVKDAKLSLELVKDHFNKTQIDGMEYWYSNNFSLSDKIKKTIFLLPAYDEFIISYKDRKATLTSEEHKKAISANGLFRPVIILNGKVIGIWKRLIKKDVLDVEVEFFNSQSVSIKNKIEERAEKLGVFWNKGLRIKFS
jgi:hypothetical protein